MTKEAKYLNPAIGASYKQPFMMNISTRTRLKAALYDGRNTEEKKRETHHRAKYRGKEVMKLTIWYRGYKSIIVD